MRPTGKLSLLAVLAAFGLSVARADYTVDQSMTLTGDLNWQYNGTITIPAGVTIDLAGHKLSVRVLAGSGEITDTSASSGGDPGELHIVVPAGCTYGNSSVVISGNLKLVKDGAGTYTPTVDYYYTYGDKTYTGGTVVADGTFKAMTLYYPWEPDVTVNAGAVLDIDGKGSAGGNAEISGWYTLNGGTMVNAGYAFPDPAKFSDLMHNLRLTADSCLNVKKNFGMRNAKGSAETFIDLDGHVLDIQIASGCNFNLANCTISSGTVKTGGGGGRLSSGLRRRD